MKLFYVQAKINLTDYAHCIVAAKGKKKAIELVEDADQIVGVDDNFFTVEKTKDLDILYHDHPREELLRVIYDRKIPVAEVSDGETTSRKAQNVTRQS